MAFQSVPQCAKVAIEGISGSKQLANVLHFKFAGAYGQTDMDNLAQAVDNAVGSDYLPVITAGAQYVQTVATGLEFINDIQSVDVTSAGVGGISGAQLNNNVTLCVTIRTALTGRSARGRFYAWPTGASQLSAANTFSAGYGNALQAAVDQMKINAAGYGWTMVIVSRRTLGALRPVGVGFPVTSIAYRNLISDSQRGRLPIGH